MNEPTHFDLVTTGGGFAGPCTAVLEAGTDASYLTVHGEPLRDIAQLERAAQHDFPTDSATGQPFRRRSDYKMM